MFKFFTGTVDELLDKVGSADNSEIDRITDDNTLLNHEEIVASVMDEYKLSKEQAEKIAIQIQVEEFHKICREMVKDGILEITSYDEEGQPVYVNTSKAEEILRTMKENEKA